MFWLANPFVRYVFFLILGILFANYQVSYVVFGLSILALVFVFLLLKNDNFYWWIFFMVFGFGLFKFQNQDFKLKSEEIVVKGKVDSWVQSASKWNKVKFQVNFKYLPENKSWKPISEKILLYFPADCSSVFYGDILLLKLKLQEVPTPSNPFQMDYRKYMQRHHIHLIAFVKDIYVTEKSTHKDLFYFSYKIRSYFENKFLKYIKSPNERAILDTMVLGIKNQLDKDLYQAYSSAGIIHLLAISGLHIALFFELISSLLSFIPKIRKYNIFKLLVILVIIWSYSFVVGLGASVVRASLMYSIYLIGQIFQRDKSIINTLFLSAFIILCFDVNYLFDIGFQLSYLAVLGIFLIQPLFGDWAEKGSFVLKKIKTIITLTLSAQIATLGLTWFYFHKISFSFLIANLLVIPLSEIILYVAMLFLAVSEFDFLANWIAWILESLVKAMNYLALLHRQIPGGVLEKVGLNFSSLLFLYCSIILIISYLYFKKRILFIISLSSFFLVFIFETIFLYQSSKQNEIVIHDANGEILITYKKGLKANQIVNLGNIKRLPISYLTDNYIAHNYIQSQKIQTFFSDSLNYKLKLDNTTILLVQNNHLINSQYLVNANILITNRKFIKNIPQKYWKKIVLKDKYPSSYYSELYQVAKSGAYIMKL